MSDNGGMTSRQRVVAALNHQEPDRVPIDFGSNYNTSVNVIAYNRLKKHLGVGSPTYMRYTIPMLAAVDLDEGLEVMKLMGGDVLPLPRYFVDGVLTKDWKEWRLKDGSISDGSRPFQSRRHRERKPGTDLSRRDAVPHAQEWLLLRPGLQSAGRRRELSAVGGVRRRVYGWGRHFAQRRRGGGPEGAGPRRPTRRRTTRSWATPMGCRCSTSASRPSDITNTSP